MNTHLITPKTFADRLAQERAEPITYYNPYLKSSTLSMVYAPRGVGKSQYCFFLGLAIARGDRFATGHTERSRVLYIDGEMGSDVWVRRLPKNQVIGKDAVKNFGMLCPEDFPDCQIPSIGDEKHQKYYLELAKSFDVIFIDNYLTTCYQTDRRDDEISLWQAVQRLLIKLREAGKAVVLVHHTSKSGVQYGSILKENLMDTIIRIRKFPIQLNEQGITLELKVEKDRHNSFKGHLESCLQMTFTDEAVTTQLKNLQNMRGNFIAEKRAKGLTGTEIADGLGLSLGEVKELMCKIDDENPEAII